MQAEQGVFAEFSIDDVANKIQHAHGAPAGDHASHAGARSELGPVECKYNGHEKARAQAAGAKHNEILKEVRRVEHGQHGLCSNDYGGDIADFLHGTLVGIGVDVLLVYIAHDTGGNEKQKAVDTAHHRCEGGGNQ